MLASAVGIGAIWLLTWVNVRGVRTAGSVQVVTTILKLAPLVAVGTLGLLYIDPETSGRSIPAESGRRSQRSPRLPP